MAIEPGTQFGSYEIVAAIGAGGMGEVYRATDTKLGRDVAIKTLPAALASDPDRLARFEREAKLLAALNHAHIASVYSLGEHDGTLYLAMELVDGQTLEEKLKAGALPLADALQLALQIAEALDAAHAKGVVHRDLKPANIMVTPDGVVKVLDFGLAKAFAGDPNSSSPAHSPALSMAMTQAGLILGTAGYMSPEQASGQATDQRADVWAFGVVLYEMLTGLPLFSGESVPHVLAAVLQTDPDWSRLPADLHPRIRLMLERCLRKKPRERYHSIADARVDIEDVLDDPHGVAEQSTQLAAVANRPIAARLAAAVGLIAIGGVLAALVLWTATRPEPEDPVRLTLLQAPSGALLGNGIDNQVEISPTGRHVAYAIGGFGGSGGNNLFVRSLGELTAIPLAGPARGPFFSPDGSRVGYFTAPVGALNVVSVAGGAPIQLEESRYEGARGASWGSDDGIIFATIDSEIGLMRIAAAGGDVEVLTRPDTAAGETDHWNPQHLPDGDHVLFTIRRGGRNQDSDVAMLDLRSGEYEVLIPGASYARYSRSGHIIFAAAGVVRVVPFDLDTLELRGIPTSIPDEILVQPRSGTASFSLSPDGTLVYVTGEAESLLNTLVWIDRDGREEPLNVPPRSYVYASLSPDGTRIALDIRDEDSDVWIFDIERQTLQRLTFDPGQNRGVAWSPDGQRVAFSREIDGTEELYWQAADGSGVPEALTRDSVAAMFLSDMSRDGSTLFYQRAASDEIWTVAIDGTPAAGTPLIATAFNETNATLSPDGRWLAVESNESGRSEIYVRPYPNVDAGRRQISTDGGTRPLWRRDGGELFYLRFDGPTITVRAVEVESDASFRAGVPQTLFSYSYSPVNTGRYVYDVSPDGNRFLVVKPVDSPTDADPRRIVVVENWFTELERLAPTQ